MKIKKGDSFVCISKVIMNNERKDISYKKGFIYLSEIDGCITNDTLNVNHSWPKGTEVNRYFVKIKSN